MDYEKEARDAFIKLHPEMFGWAKANYPTFSDEDKKFWDSIFPELRESEDERIRKEIISALKFANTSDGVYDKHIAWLEKQKEQKPMDLPPGFYFITPDGKKYYSKEFRYGDMKMKVVENEKKED